MSSVTSDMVDVALVLGTLDAVGMAVNTISVVLVGSIAMDRVSLLSPSTIVSRYLFVSTVVDNMGACDCVNCSSMITLELMGGAVLASSVGDCKLEVVSSTAVRLGVTVVAKEMAVL